MSSVGSPVSESRSSTRAEKIQDASGHHEVTREYFRRLRRRLRITLMVSYLVPLVILSVYFHFQFNFTLKESGKLHLTNLAESQKNTIDLFWRERVANLRRILHMHDFKLAPGDEDMRRYLERIQQTSEFFSDLGLIDPSGRQIGYAGPHHLKSVDYSEEQWYQALLRQQDKDHYISDVYLGFRKSPHFTVAVRQIIGNQPYVLRATINPVMFTDFLRRLGRGKQVDSVLINRDGFYQTDDPAAGDVLEESPYDMSYFKSRSGAFEVKTPSRELVAYYWLDEMPWVLVTRQPLDLAYAGMYQTRVVIMIATAVLILVIFSIIWLTTDRLLKQAQATEESRVELKSQLLHAAKLVALGELAAGVAHEINNPLAIISSEAGLISDMLDPRFGLDSSPESIKGELAHIEEAVGRAREITQKLLNFSRRNEPKLVRRNLNQLLDEVVSGLKEREFEVSNIRLVRDYDVNLPDLLVEPDQLRQVFLNLINNAGDAIKGPGTITLTTAHDEEHVRITVTDTGKGMTNEEMHKIFMPFYTTKDPGKGTGLGLPISLSIVESMGGRIEAQSMPGAGSSFTVILPLNKEGGV